MTLNFDNMTIGELRQMIRDYNRLQQEMLWIKRKYPNAAAEVKNEDFDLNKMIEGLN